MNYEILFFEDISALNTPHKLLRSLDLHLLKLEGNQPSSAAPQSRVTATNRENASDKPKGNRKLDGSMQATEDRHGSPTGSVPECCSPSDKLISEFCFSGSIFVQWC